GAGLGRRSGAGPALPAGGCRLATVEHEQVGQLAAQARALGAARLGGAALAIELGAQFATLLTRQTHGLVDNHARDRLAGTGAEDPRLRRIQAKAFGGDDAWH